MNKNILLQMLSEIIRIQILGGTGSQVKKSQIVKNTQHPNYEEGFTFILSDTWADCAAEISILENSSGITIIIK